jgi:hypothetical protein
MFTTRTRRLTAGLALALGLGLAPSATAGATGHKAPTPAPPPPPIGADDIVTARPLLSVELDDAVEAAGLIEGRLRLSSPLDTPLQVDVAYRFPGVGPQDLGCEWLSGGGCDHRLELELEPGTTLASFTIDVVDDGAGGEDAELVGVELEHPHPASAVRLGPAAEAVLYDGDGLELALADDAPEAPEGDPGSDGTLDLVVEANQAVPHPVTFRVRTGIVGGYNGATPPGDYAAVDVVVELPAGETTLAVEVPLVGDQLDEEPYELLFGHVQEPSHGEIAFDGGTAVARILDDDGPVVTWERPGDYQSPSRSARSAALTA